MWKQREECQKFRHYGLQRSGTNLLEAMMYRYFEVWCRNKGSGPGWKHSLEMAPFEDDMFYLVISKNPYSWVESIAFRNPMDYIETQNTYPAQEPIQSEFVAGSRRINVINAAKTWNHFYKNWEKLKDHERVYLLRYEDLLVKGDDILKDIHEKFGCEWRKNPLSYHSSETKILNKKQEKRITEYYLSGKPDKLTQKQISAISSHIDKSLFDLFEYEHL